MRNLDMPKLRGRKDHGREQEKSGSDRDPKSDEEFEFRSAEEAEGGSAEESESAHKGSNRRVDRAEVSRAWGR